MLPPSSEQWRRYGEARRRELLEGDDGAVQFRISASCGVHKYFDLAERVRHKYLTFEWWIERERLCFGLCCIAMKCYIHPI